MTGFVLIADGMERRGSARIEHLALEGHDASLALGPVEARSLLPRAELVVFGEFAGSAAQAQEMIRDVRAGRAPGVDPRLRVIATADTEQQIISAFSAGADLTVPRAGSSALIAASVAALTRRQDFVESPPPVRIGPLEVNAAGRQVTFDGQQVHLSPREMDVLVLLARRPGRVFTKDEISWEVWGGPDLKTSRALSTHLHRMAQKFRQAGASELVQNVWGTGYKLNNDLQGGVER
jgi:two-component system response regulator QseB